MPSNTSSLVQVKTSAFLIKSMSKLKFFIRSKGPGKLIARGGSFGKDC